MSQTINRMYDNHTSANRAADALRSNRFNRFTHVHVVSRSASPEAPLDDIVAEVMKAFVLKSHARVLAQRIQRGGTLVTVHAPFGSAVAAINILDRHGPVESGLPDHSDAAMAWDEAAPLSSALQMPVLLKNSATFSRFWNIPAVSKRGATTSSVLGLPELSDQRGPYAGTLGKALISNNATPLSSMLGLPLLTKPKPARR